MLWNSFGSLVFLGFQWLTTVVVIRLSNGYEVAGQLALSMAIYNAIAPLAIYRMYTYQVSDIHRENSAGEYIAFRMVTCLIALFVGIVYGFSTSPASSYAAIALFILYRIPGLLIDVLHGTDQLNSRMDFVGKSLALQGICTFLSFCVCMVAFQSLEVSILSMALVTSLIGLFYDYPRTNKLEKIHIGITADKTIHLLKLCLPIVVAAVACSLAPSIPRQFLAISEGESSLGIYASVAAPIAIIQMGASYIYNPLLGSFSSLYSEGNIKKLMLLLGKATLGILAIGIVSAVILVFIGSPLLAFLYGSDITAYLYLMNPLIACSLIIAYVWFLNDLFVSFRLFKYSFLSNILSLILSLALTIPFVNAFSMNGVSFVGIVGHGATAILMVIFLEKALSAKAQKQP